MVRKPFILLMFLYFSLTMPVFAQQTAQDVGFTDPGRIERELRQSLAQPVADAAPVREEAEQPVKPIPEAEKIRFKLTKIKFIDHTVYSDSELQAVVQPYMNKTISLVDLQNIVKELTKKYRSDGYILSRAILPPQEIVGGVVTIQLVEGYISKVEVAGSPGRTQGLLEQYGDKVLDQKPLQFKKLEHAILLANDIPGLRVKAVITPSKTIPGSADLTMAAERTRGGVSASYDNFGTRFIGPHQIGINGNLNSVLTPGDYNLARFVVTSRTKELQFGQLIHSLPIGTNGMRLALSATYADTQPQFTLAHLNIVGRTEGYSAELNYPWIRSREKNLFLHGIVHYQNVTSKLNRSLFYADRIRSLALGTNFDNIDRFRGANAASFDFEHGFPILGADDHELQSRKRGRAAFTKINLALSRLQSLFSRFSLLAAMQGQYAYNPLLATEQFGVGGPDDGRGYDPSEIVGDRGVAAKVELRIDTAPGRPILQAVQYYVFYDAGMIWNLDKVNLATKQTLTSTGFGARIYFMKNLSGNVFAAKPLTFPVATNVALGRNGNMTRYFFQLLVSA